MLHMTFNYVGKKIRLSRILRDSKAVVFAFDHGVEHGPKDFPLEHIDPKVILKKVVDAGVDAIMLLPGLASLTHDVWANRTALIVKVTGKTNLRPEDQRLLQNVFGYVEDAVALGADAVAATVYWGSPYEGVMMDLWFSIREAAERYGLPCLQLAYPRGPAIKNMYDVEIVKYGVRAAVESGADLIKTYYTGSKESFSEVVKIASGVPILMSGGPARENPLEFLRDVRNVIEVGAQGVVVGRNVFRHKNPRGMIKAIMAIVHEDKHPEDVVKYLE